MVVLAILAALARADDPPGPPPPLEPLTFTRLIVRNGDGTLLGAAPDAFRIQILERLRADGLNVRGAESVLFDQDQSEQATMRLGGTVTDVRCEPTRSGSHCELTVDWELFDVRREAVVYEVVTLGAADVQGFADRANGAREGLMAALDSMAKREKFRAALVPSTETAIDGAPSWSGVLDLARCDRPDAALPDGMESTLSGTVLVRAGARLGSGAMLTSDGFVVTAAHVVAGATAVDITTRNGLELPADVVRVDRYQDVALLDVGGRGFACLPAGTTPTPGAELYAVGSPLGEGLEFSVSKGVVSGVRTLDGYQYLQTDASLNGGNSGGPLVDAHGRVVAVVSWKVVGSGYEGLGFGVPLDVVIDRLDLAWADASDPVEASHHGERGGAAGVAIKVTDTPDTAAATITGVSIASDASPPASLAGDRHTASPGATAVLLTSGGVGLAGGVTVYGTWVWYLGVTNRGDAVDPATWRALQAVNAVGWAALGVGAVGFVAGTQMTVAAGPGGVTIGGRL
jgi:serine protease Do